MTNTETSKLPELNFDAAGELEVIASPSSSQNDFDFFEGKWKLHNKKIKTRLNQCTEWIEFDQHRKCTSPEWNEEHR